ncbi:MAG: GntR family transcriptional regulator [Acidimicrobiales bacterium]
MGIDRTSSVPLWAQVLEDLRARLSAGEFADRFPSDLQLVNHYGVSRQTAREAAHRLQMEGVIERGRGRGTFLTGRTIEQPLGTLYSLFRSVEAQGFTQTSITRHLEERRDATAARMLGCSSRAPLVYLERIRLADDEPIAIDSSWLPADRSRPLLSVDFAHTALYHELAAKCGLSPNAGWERIRPVLPDREQRALLAIGALEPVFAIERLAFRDQTPIEWRHSVVRGDRYAFMARWSNQQLDASFEPADLTTTPSATLREA